jgi:hypothetical protein
MNNNPNFNPEDRSFRKQGVRLKRFEAVVTNILSSSVEPKYVRLGRKMGEERKGESDWPFNILPVAARVLGKGPGQLRNPKRAAKKEGQIRNILRVVLKLAPKDKNITIVDFGGGESHKVMPFALYSCSKSLLINIINRIWSFGHSTGSSLAKGNSVCC